MNHNPTLDSEPHECVSLPLDRSRGRVLGGARPAGLGEAGRSPSGPSRPLVLPMLHSAFVHPPRKWVAGLLQILGCLASLWTKVDAFRCIQLNQSPTLDSEPHECVSWLLDRSRGIALEGQSAWVSTQFCPILVHLLLQSKLIQNLWNSLELTKYKWSIV